MRLRIPYVDLNVFFRTDESSFITVCASHAQDAAKMLDKPMYPSLINLTFHHLCTHVYLGVIYLVKLNKNCRRLLLASSPESDNA